MLIRNIIQESHLSEVFEKPYNYSIAREASGMFRVEFKTDSDQKVSFVAEYEIADWPNRWDISFAVEGKRTVTGGGDQFRIFATVIKIFGEFLNRYKPNIVDFTAQKEIDSKNSKVMDHSSRVKLYDRMVKKLAVTAGYKFNRMDLGLGVLYRLSKQQTNVSESLDKPYSYKISAENKDLFQARFKTTDGRNVAFNADIDPDEGPDWSVMFNVAGQWNITGTGDQFRILATVVKIFKEFLNKYEPDLVDFTARKSDAPVDAEQPENSSRVKLYDRMVKKLAAAESYQFTKKDTGIEVRYRLTKAGSKANNVSESKLNELFNKTYTYSVTTKTDEKFEAHFETNDDRSVFFKADKIISSSPWSVSFSVDGQHGATGDGDQYRIFSTVIRIFKDFASVYDPQEIGFTADKDNNFAATRNSRVGLYDRMIKKFVMTTDYQVERNDMTDSILYMIYKS